MNIFKNLRSMNSRKGEKEFVKWSLNYIKANGIDNFLYLMRNRIGIPVELPIDALWRVHRVNELPAHKNLSRSQKVSLWRNGLMESQLIEEKFNKIMDAYKFAIIANNIGTPNADQHLKIDHIGLGTLDLRPNTGTPATTTDALLGREFYRDAPDELYRSTSSLVAILYLDAATANPTNTTVASGSSTTVFTVQAGQGANYDVGDVIRVFTTLYETVTVLSVSTDTITLNALTPLTMIPTAGMSVERGFGELGMFCGQSTGSIETGTLVNHADLRFFKNNATSILVEIHLNYLTQN